MRNFVVSLAALFMLTAGLASAGPAPALYFLKDGELGPAGPGILNGTAPDGLDPSVRPIVAGTPDAPTTLFYANEAHPGRLYGPLFIALWPGPSMVIEGNMTVEVYAIGPSADPLGLTPGDLTSLSKASVNLDFNASNMPDPTSLIPPDPTDPEAAAAYIMAQALMMTLQPPAIFNLGFVDVEIPEDHRLALGLYLEPKDGATLPLPLPVGAAATLQYDGQLMPSFAYVPWYAPDPEPTTPPSAPGGPGPSPTSGSPGSGGATPAPTLGPGSGSESKGSPAAGVFAMLALLGAAAVLVRRRL